MCSVAPLLDAVFFWFIRPLSNSFLPQVRIEMLFPADQVNTRICDIETLLWDFTISLIYGVQSRVFGITTLLLDAGADISCKDKDHKSAFKFGYH